MGQRKSCYQGTAIALATMHGKERAIGKPFARVLGATIVVPDGIDTDAYGTFTGEIPRLGTMLDAARAKANVAADVTGLANGMGSEGSFGPHPSFPFIPAGKELLVFIDRHRDIEVHEFFLSERTNYNTHVCRPGDNIAAFLKSIEFPSHAAVVTPHQPGLDAHSVKGLVSFEALVEAMARVSSASSDGLVRLGSDMRAHLNPTRLASIRVVAYRLSRRLASLCPSCGVPGFGLAEIARGLPCAWCGRPTAVAVAEVHRCPKCSFEERRPIRNLPVSAEPGSCQNCNP